jgi:hypothetical protein
MHLAPMPAELDQLVTPDAQNLLSIGIVGALVSVLVEMIKTRFGTDSLTTKALTILLCILLGGAYSVLSGTAAYQGVLGTLLTATTIWAFVRKGS